MKDIEQAQRYLVMAGKDHLALRGMGDKDLFSVEIFGFHVQQAVEKVLKAWLCCLGIPVPRIHDLDELDEILHNAGAHLPTVFSSLLAYTDFAVTFRYDIFLDIEDDINRYQVCQDLENLIAYIRDIINADTVD